MSINYIPRVTQLDAVQLDEQVEELLKQMLYEATKYLEPGILQPIFPELELLLRTWIFKYSVWDKKATFGQQMLSLKYKQDFFSRSKLFWYYGYAVGFRYIRERVIYSFTTITKLQNFMNTLETFQVLSDMLNFLRFIKNGKHPVLIDFILGLELSADKLTREDLSDLSWTRELLWHNSIELLGTLISLMNIFGLKRRLSNALKFMWWRSYKGSPMATNTATMTLGTLCAYCSNSPVLPYSMRCSHLFCFYCLKANKIADVDFCCPKCYFNGKEVKKFVISC